jgi:hypothetical protein
MHALHLLLRLLHLLLHLSKWVAASEHDAYAYASAGNLQAITRATTPYGPCLPWLPTKLPSVRTSEWYELVEVSPMFFFFEPYCTSMTAPEAGSGAQCRYKPSLITPRGAGDQLPNPACASLNRLPEHQTPWAFDTVIPYRSAAL